VAIKMTDLSNIPDQRIRRYEMDRLATEARALELLQGHPNIAKILYHEFGASTLPDLRYDAVVVMECYHTELFYFIKTGHFEESLARTFFSQLMNALSAMAARGLCHRDIKPENILFDRFFNLKLCDFGFAKFKEDTNARLHTLCGSPIYRAPEVDRGEAYVGELADIWSSGCVLFTLLVGYPPFSPKQGDWYFGSLASGKFGMFWKQHGKHRSHIKDLSEPSRALINDTLVVDPRKRHPLALLLEHPWLREVRDCIYRFHGLLRRQRTRGASTGANNT